MGAFNSKIADAMNCVDKAKVRYSVKKISGNDCQLY